MENLSRVFQKQKRKKNTRLTFITQFKIEFLLLFPSFRKMLGKRPDHVNHLTLHVCTTNLN